jgi:hypothetical protein
MSWITRTDVKAFLVFGVVAFAVAVALGYAGLRPWVGAMIAFIAGTVVERLYRLTRR